MFNNLIYFIVIILIFNIPSPSKSPEMSPGFCFFGILLTWIIFGLYCQRAFRTLIQQPVQPLAEDGRLIAQHQKLTAKLSILAVFSFAVITLLFDFKGMILHIPGLEPFTVLQGILALALFFLFLCTLWYGSHPSYQALFGKHMSAYAYIRSNVKINLPIVFPWLFFSLVYDLFGLSRFSHPDSYLNTSQGQIIFFVLFLIVLILIMPFIIQYFWGCTPLDDTEKSRQLKAFLRKNNFKYRSLLKWPIFEGRMLTAGIMGFFPANRYLLITDSLLEALSLDELRGVLAHEMGHAKYFHHFFYMVFFLGFTVISFGLFDPLLYFFYSLPFFNRMIAAGSPQASSLFYIFLSVPMLVILIVYFRYIMGFFMRNFERQADLYSARVLKTPEPIINSLEKIGILSGKIRDLPSWHHFSIKQRTAYLKQTLNNPRLASQHNRYVLLSFVVYMVSVVSLGYVLNFSPIKKNILYTLIQKELIEQLEKEPDNVDLNQELAMVYHETDQLEDAIHIYNRIISLDPNHAVALNNLAWLLITVPNPELHDYQRALALAKKAVAIEKTPVFLDTLAEAYYVNGYIKEAVRIITEAISLEPDNKRYYEKQRKKFMDALRS